jgi:3-(methylthio)propionyl---CoA ligase
MRGLMQERPLLLSGLLTHAETYHGRMEIVSRTVEGPIHRYTNAEMAARARRLASALERRGVAPGEMLGSLAWNHYRHLEVFHAVPGAGRVLHTANPRLFPEQIAYAVNHAGERWLFFDLACLELVEGMAAELTQIETYVALTDRQHMPAGSRLANLACYEELLEEGDAEYRWPSFDERRASTLCYTSGTTGDPKGALYSHRGTVLQAWAVCGAGAAGFASDDCILPLAPLYHCNAWSAAYASALTGAKLVLPGRAHDSAALHQLIVGEGVTVALAVPTVWLAMLAWLEETGNDLGGLKRILSGGSAVPLSLMQRLEREYGIATIHAWGMTETTAAASYASARKGATPEAADAVRRRQGVPLYGSELRIVDDEGRELPWDGEAVGHLRARGHWIASAYFRREGEPLLDAEGWLPTGDVASIDAAGSIEITDRSKDLVKSGGEWISSIQLENAAVGHPGVAEAAVIAVPHPKWLERPLLVVVRAKGSAVTADEVRAFLAARVAKWWLPEEVAFVDELPHTATGKIQKTALRQRFAKSPARQT